MKKIITESQLKNIVKETVRKVLNEGKDANQLADAFVKKNPNLNKEGLIKLLMADPTASQNDRGSFAGKYGVWIGNIYANGGIKPGDAPELKSALFTYDKNKTQLPQIKDCKSLSELIGWVKDLSDDFKPVRKQSKSRADLEKVYEDNEWVVYVPHSHAAARRGGEGTHWCTASENPEYYNYYTSDGPLYINIRKSDGAKFQFHFESSQFMDANDEEIKLRNIGLSEGVINFYTKIKPWFRALIIYDYVEKFCDGFAGVELDEKSNFINTEGQLLSKQWFDNVYEFHEGVAKVRMDDNFNFINTKGRLLSKRWFGYAEDFSNGLSRVFLKNKCNFMNTEGQFLSRQWFEQAESFEGGLSMVKLNGKCNFIDTKGVFLSNQWFDRVGGFINGLAYVKLDGKYNYINKEGQLLSKQWFDSQWEFCNGFARVMLNGKCNFIDKSGRILSNQWFDRMGDFRNGFAIVELDDKQNMIKSDGQILSNQWFDDMYQFFEGFAIVVLNRKCNFINTDGQLLSKQWFDNVNDFHYGVARIGLNGKRGTIDTEGNITLDESKHSALPIITESILKKIKSECIRRILSEKEL